MLSFHVGGAQATMAACAQQVAAAPAAAASAASGGGFGPLAAARKQKPCATCHDLFEFSQNIQRCCGKACKAALNAALIAAKRANVVESLRLTSDTSTLQKMTSALAAGRAAAVAGDGLNLIPSAQNRRSCGYI